QELVRAQEALAGDAPEPWTRPDEPFLVGGCFVCFGRGGSGHGEAGEPGWAGAVLMRRDHTLGRAVAAGAAGAPYAPGLPAPREGALLAQVVAALPERPAVLLVNGTGRDHPRNAGLAVHLGAVLDVATVGVTDRPLVATG